MPTTSQLLRRKTARRRKTRKRGRRVLGRAPLLSGIVTWTGVREPKKPNSAKRKCCRVRLSNGVEVTCHIPGEGHTIQEHSRVFVRGGRVKDIPGVRYKVIRGAADVAAEISNSDDGRTNSRSRYGAKKPIMRKET